MSDAQSEWEEAQEWEAGWWGNCVNTFGEEAKQITYAHRMGLTNIGIAGGYWPLYDLAGQAIVDLGGGPASILLKCVNARRPVVVDPGSYPLWVAARYRIAGIEWRQQPAEKYRTRRRFDEAWIYNVLQHVIDPEAVVARARAAAATVRIFEWIDLAPYEGHLHELRQADLDRWLDTTGTVEVITENGIEEGRAYYAATG